MLLDRHEDDQNAMATSDEPVASMPTFEAKATGHNHHSGDLHTVMPGQLLNADLGLKCFDIVALVSNDLVTDQRMQRSLISLSAAGLRCALVGRTRPASKPIDNDLPFAQIRHSLSYDRGKRFYVALNRAHYRYLCAHPPLVILAVDLDTIAAAALASRRLKIPYVFDAHELFEEMPEVARRPLVKLAWSLWGRLWVPKAAGAYTVGHEIATRLSANYGIPFGVVRNFPLASRSGLNSQEAIAGPNLMASEMTSRRSRKLSLPKSPTEQPFTILYQGALNEGRGIEELIEAVAECSGTRAWIVGDGPEASKLRAFAKTWPSADVRFFGELKPDELLQLTPQADLGYALMRDVSLNYRLSLSNKSIDYIHAGLPSLQMDWPEYRRLQDKYGCFELVESLTVPQVCAAIERCRDQIHYDLLSSYCTAAAPELTWERDFGFVHTLLSRLLKKLG